MSAYSMTPTRGPSDYMGGGFGSVGTTIYDYLTQGLDYAEKMRKRKNEEMIDRYRVPAAAAGFDASQMAAQRGRITDAVGLQRDRAGYSLTTAGRPTPAGGPSRSNIPGFSTAPPAPTFGIPGPAPMRGMNGELDPNQLTEEQLYMQQMYGEQAAPRDPYDARFYRAGQ